MFIYPASNDSRRTISISHFSAHLSIFILHYTNVLIIIIIMVIIRVNLHRRQLNWKILSDQGFAARMPLLKAAGAFRLGEDDRILLSGATYTVSIF